MFLIKRICVNLSKAEVKVEDGLRITNLAKAGQKPNYKLIDEDDKWPHLEIFIWDTEKLEKDSNGVMTLNYVSKSTIEEVADEIEDHTKIKDCEKEDIIDGYIVTVYGMTPGSTVTLTGKKLEGLYPEDALIKLKEGEVFDFRGRLKISVQHGDLIVEYIP